MAMIRCKRSHVSQKRSGAINSTATRIPPSAALQEERQPRRQGWGRRAPHPALPGIEHEKIIRKIRPKVGIKDTVFLGIRAPLPGDDVRLGRGAKIPEKHKKRQKEKLEPKVSLGAGSPLGV